LKVVVAPFTAGSATWLADPSAGARARTASDTVLGAWGKSPGLLDGYTLRLEPGDDGTIDCGGTLTFGCTTVDSGGGGSIKIQVQGLTACAEDTVLVHEIGHVALAGDPGHSDPRWYSAEFGQQVVQSLLATIPAEDAACVAALQVRAARVTYLLSYGNGA
jgi:hypothetical protein